MNLTKERLLEVNDELNNAVESLFELRHPELYGAFGRSFDSISSVVQRAIGDFDQICYLETPNLNFKKAIDTMRLNYDFILYLSKPNSRVNEYLIDCWQDGRPSRMYGMAAYKITSIELEKILNGDTN